MGNRDIIAVLAEELAFALQPLIAAFRTSSALRDFVAELGWDFIAAPSALDSVRAPAEALYELASRSNAADVEDTSQLLGSIRHVFNAIAKLKSAGGLPNDFKNEFPRQLIDYLVVDYLLRGQPRWGYLLMTLGIVRLEERPAAGNRPAYLRRVLAYEEIPQLFNDSLMFLKNTYRWGLADFDGVGLIQNLGCLFDAWRLPVREELLDSQTLAQLTSGALRPQEILESALHIALVEHSLDPSGFSTGIGLFLLPETANGKPGLALLPFASAGVEEEIVLSDRLTLGFEGGIDLTGGVGILIHPDRDIEFKVGFGSSTPSSAAGNLAIALRLANAGAPFILLGSPDASRFEVTGVSAIAGAHLASNSKFELFIEFAFQSGNIVIQPGPDAMDGFVARLLPREGIRVRVDPTVGFSSKQGLYFGGSGGIEVTIPVHRSIGPLIIDSAYIAISPKKKITIMLAASFAAKIGPVGVSIERMGMEIPFSFPQDSSGNLGPVDVQKPSYLPPRGAGLVVKTSSVTGGGFVEFDRDNKRYAGILQLAFKKFALTAVGLIETKMPDDSKGFSMLIIICVEFKPGIALGYGFFLDGAGGIVATHRTMLVDVLRDGLKTGTADAVLFPENPILNAPRIMSDLRSVFPPSEGHFIIGPIALISFMQLARFEIGIMIELPGPSRIVLVGQNSLKLPNATNPRLEIHEDILGVIDFDRKTLSYDATIYNSHFLKFTLTGDSALRLILSENKSFAAAAGGLNPRFDPPPGFPTLRRLCLSLGNGDNPRINLETYVAITSNSAQHGSRVEIYASKGKFGIKGHMGYDVLLVFSPFSFIADMNAGVSVSAFGETICSADLDLTLSGPSPWKATGKATFELLRMKKSVHVSATWGDEEPASLEAVDPSYQLIEELKKPISLAGILPGDRDISVSLRPPANPQSNEITVHPEGKLEVRQRVLPLQIELAKFGGAPIIGTNFFDVVARSDRTDAPEKDIQDEPLMDDFARGQFEELSDSERLSCPSYEKFKAGILIGSDGITCEHAVPCMLEYETQVIDENGISQPHGFQRLPWRYGARLVTGSAARLGNKRNSGSNRYANPGATPIVRTKEEGYVVVWTKDLTRFNSMKGNDGSMTFTKAKQELAKYLRENPGARGSLEVVRTHEAQPERAVA